VAFVPRPGSVSGPDAVGIDSTRMEAVMPTEWTKLVIGMVAAMLVAAINTSTMGSAFAQAGSDK